MAASCALPGLMRPVTLMALDHRGIETPFHAVSSMHSIDGSVANDIPLEQLALCFHVHRTIVSQANPHLAPLLREASMPQAAAASSSLFSRTLNALELLLNLDITTRTTYLARMRLLPRFFGAEFSALFLQRYTGDITIAPQQPLLSSWKALSQPSEQDMRDYLLRGMRATWPQLAHIRTLVAVEKKLSLCAREIAGAVAAEAAAGALSGRSLPYHAYASAAGSTMGPAGSSHGVAGYSSASAHQPYMPLPFAPAPAPSLRTAPPGSDRYDAYEASRAAAAAAPWTVTQSGWLHPALNPPAPVPASQLARGGPSSGAAAAASGYGSAASASRQRRALLPDTGGSATAGSAGPYSALAAGSLLSPPLAAGALTGPAGPSDAVHAAALREHEEHTNLALRHRVHSFAGPLHPGTGPEFADGDGDEAGSTRSVGDNNSSRSSIVSAAGGRDAADEEVRADGRRRRDSSVTAAAAAMAAKASALKAAPGRTLTDALVQDLSELPIASSGRSRRRKHDPDAAGSSPADLPASPGTPVADSSRSGGGLLHSALNVLLPWRWGAPAAAPATSQRTASARSGRGDDAGAATGSSRSAAAAARSSPERRLSQVHGGYAAPLTSDLSFESAVEGPSFGSAAGREDDGAHGAGGDKKARGRRAAGFRDGTDGSVGSVERGRHGDESADESPVLAALRTYPRPPSANGSWVSDAGDAHDDAGGVRRAAHGGTGNRRVTREDRARAGFHSFAQLPDFESIPSHLLLPADTSDRADSVAASEARRRRDTDGTPDGDFHDHHDDGTHHHHHHHDAGASWDLSAGDAGVGGRSSVAERSASVVSGRSSSSSLPAPSSPILLGQGLAPELLQPPAAPLPQAGYLAGVPAAAGTGGSPPNDDEEGEATPPALSLSAAAHTAGASGGSGSGGRSSVRSLSAGAGGRGTTRRAVSFAAPPPAWKVGADDDGNEEASSLGARPSDAAERGRAAAQQSMQQMQLQLHGSAAGGGKPGDAPWFAAAAPAAAGAGRGALMAAPAAPAARDAAASAAAAARQAVPIVITPPITPAFEIGSPETTTTTARHSPGNVAMAMTIPPLRGTAGAISAGASYPGSIAYPAPQRLGLSVGAAGSGAAGASSSAAPWQERGRSMAGAIGPAGALAAPDSTYSSGSPGISPTAAWATAMAAGTSLLSSSGGRHGSAPGGSHPSHTPVAGAGTSAAAGPGAWHDGSVQLHLHPALLGLRQHVGPYAPPPPQLHAHAHAHAGLSAPSSGSSSPHLAALAASAGGPMTPLLRSMPPGPAGFHSTARQSSGSSAAAAGARAGSALAAPSVHAAGGLGALRGQGLARQSSGASESSQGSASPLEQLSEALADAKPSRAPRTSPLSLSAPARPEAQRPHAAGPSVDSAAPAALVLSPDGATAEGASHEQAQAVALLAPVAPDVDAGTGAASGSEGLGNPGLTSDEAGPAVAGHVFNAQAIGEPPAAPQPFMHASSSQTDFLGGSDGGAGEGSHSGAGAVTAAPAASEDASA